MSGFIAMYACECDHDWCLHASAKTTQRQRLHCKTSRPTNGKRAHKGKVWKRRVLNVSDTVFCTREGTRLERGGAVIATGTEIAIWKWTLSALYWPVGLEAGKVID